MTKLSRKLGAVIALLLLGSAIPLAVRAQAQAQTLGMIARSAGAHIGNAPAPEGSSVYSGDYLSTDDDGSVLLRIGTLSLELQGSSGAHIYSAPYGAVVELNRGTVLYTTPGGKENLVIVAADVRVTPDVSLPDFGRVSLDNPCEVSVHSQRGQANVQSGKELRMIEQGKAYKVRAENQISYRKYLSPDDKEYHRYHEHEPCAALETVKGRPPIAPGQSHFMLVAIGVAGGLTTWGVVKALESPDRP